MGNSAPSSRGLTHDPSAGGLESPVREGAEPLEWTYHSPAEGNLSCLCARAVATSSSEEAAAIQRFLRNQVKKGQFEEMEGYDDLRPGMWRSQTIDGKGWDGEPLSYWWVEVVLLPSVDSKKPARQACFRLNRIDGALPVVHGYLLNEDQ
eukprot:Sspe_Gene.7400::Locus_2507_Transcript_1_2_Confidence_0.750_Length_611::g.7400::m.7400